MMYMVVCVCGTCTYNLFPLVLQKQCKSLVVSLCGCSSPAVGGSLKDNTSLVSLCTAEWTTFATRVSLERTQTYPMEDMGTREEYLQWKRRGRVGTSLSGDVTEWGRD